MCFNKVNFGFLAALVFAAIFFVGCSSNVNSKRHQNPDGRLTYFVTLDTQGAQEWDPITVYEGDNLNGRLQTPTKEGFLFEGWSSSGNEYVAYELDTPVITDLTLYAKWDGQSIVPAETYRLTVHLMGGAILNVPFQDIPINHKGNKTLQQLPRLNQHPNPPPEFSMGESRKVFSVWNTEPDGNGEYIFPYTLITGNVDIYALYAKPLVTTQDLREIRCNDPDAWYAFETTLLADPLITEPLCPNPNAPFRGKILPGFPEPMVDSDPRSSIITLSISGPRTHAGLFAHANGADLVGRNTNVVSLFGALPVGGSVNASYAAGGLVAEAYNTRLINIGRGVGTTSDIYAGGLVGIGDNVTISGVINNASASGEYAGGIAGKLTNSKISNIRNGATVNAATDGGYGGGVVGHMENGTIESYHKTPYFDNDGVPNVTSAHPNVSIGTQAGYLKNVDVSSIYFFTNCPTLLAQRENSTVGMVGILDGGSIKGVWTCGTATVYGNNSTAGGIVGKLLNNAIVEDVVATGAIRGADALGVLVTGSRIGGIAGDATGGTVKGALAMNSLIVGETVNLIANTNFTKSHFIKRIRNDLDDSYTFYPGGVSRYDIYDNRTFFNDALGWDFTNSSVWEMRDFYDLPVLKGTGTDFIPITTAEELHSMSNGNYVLMNDIDLSTFNGGLWTPVYFSGTLHGNNKKITNLRTNSNGLVSENTGYMADTANVRHLIIENFHIIYGGGDLRNAAAPVTTYGGVTIRDVHTSGVIDGGFREAAGIAVEIDYHPCLVSDSSFTGTIKIGEENPLAYAAGILTGGGSVSGSRSSGRIEIQNTTSTYVNNVQAAGISTGGSVHSSYSDMEIVVRHTGGVSTYNNSRIGGITVSASSGTRYNYFAGSIDLNSTGSYGYAGGIAAQGGALKTNLMLTDRITVDNSALNYGRIIGKTSTGASDAIENYALPTLAPGVDKITASSTSTAIVGNGTDLPIPMNSIDGAFLESLGWDMDVWKPVPPGTLPKLWWE
jgi:uncharacterized repeat protein (TIGR02543 family)